MKPKLAIWGASSHARVVTDIVRQRDEFEIAGYLDDLNPERAGEVFDRATVLGGREHLPALREAGVSHLILAFGDGHARVALWKSLALAGFGLATAVHPAAVVAPDAEIGAGTVIVAGAVVNPAARLGTNVIVNTCATVEHECVIGDGAHLSAGVHLGGRVSVGRCALLELGSVVATGVRIGERCVVGAGSIVLADVPDGVLAFGAPARVQRTLERRIG